MNITVLLCVKNGEKYIRSTIESILNQTFRDFEFLIIVNCSTDNTLNIINEYKDERIRVFTTNICQLSYNLNYGLSLAEGKYIARIDADDIAIPQRLQKQLDIIKNYNYDIVGSNIDLIDQNGVFLRTNRFPEWNTTIRKKILYRSVIAHPTVIVKKEVLLSVSGYLGGRYAQDYDLWLRIMRDPKLIFYNIQESLVQYRIHSEQSKGNKNSFAEVAGYFLKESIYARRKLYLLSAIIYYLKSLI